MARNTLSDLNNHLFAQLERLSDESMSQEDLHQEMERAKAINGVAKNIIDNAKTALEGAHFAFEKLPSNKAMPDQFKLNENN